MSKRDLLMSKRDLIMSKRDLFKEGSASMEWALNVLLSLGARGLGLGCRVRG